LTQAQARSSNRLGDKAGGQLPKPPAYFIMKKPETKFKEKVVKDLKELRYIWFTKTQQKSLRGTPDIIGCINGYFFALELKSSRKGKISALQSYNLQKVVEAGGRSWIAYPENWEEVFNEIKKIGQK